MTPATSARGTDLRFGEVPPDRSRPGLLEHPNIDRPGARPHPALRPTRREGPKAASERRPV